MRFPEWLYKLLAGDAGSQQLGVIWREQSTSAASTSVGTTVYTVPADKCLVLTNMAGSFEPNAAQKCVRTRFMADPPEGTVRYNFFDEWPSLVAGAFAGKTWTGEVIIPGGWKVRVEGTYDAGAAQNIARAEIHGYLIPRGTFVFG